MQFKPLDNNRYNDYIEICEQRNSGRNKENQAIQDC